MKYLALGMESKGCFLQLFLVVEYLHQNRKVKAYGQRYCPKTAISDAKFH